MSKLLLYTFSSFPYQSVLEGYPHLKFQKLKQDLNVFKKLIIKVQPDIIIGIAKSNLPQSTFETKAINVYNKHKKVNQFGPTQYMLDFPPAGYQNIKVRKTATDSFCNWTMYKLSHHLDSSHIKLQFVHLASEDISQLKKYLQLISNQDSMSL